MAKYRIYALIHGQTLIEGKIFNCKIKKMSFRTQKKRGFSPIQSDYSTDIDSDFHKTYVTFLPYVDTLKIVSEYVVVHEIEERDPRSALGGAIKAFDKLCRSLSITQLEDVKRKYGRDRGNFEPYIYQVNKIYEIGKKGKEIEVDPDLKSGFTYLPNRPESFQWIDQGIQEFLEEIYYFDDDVLQRALKYLYRSSIGFMLKDSPEKITLDHIKSIEIILKNLSSKRYFKDRLAEAGDKIGITPKEKEAIERFWEERSDYSDTAHPSPYDEAEMYPNQFPVPSNVHYSGGSFDSVAGSIILKYFKYIKGVFLIDIDEISSNSEDFSKGGKFFRIYTFFPFGTKNQNHLGYYTTEKDENRLRNKLKKNFAEHFQIPEDSIVEILLLPTKNKGLKRKKFWLRISTKG